MRILFVYEWLVKAGAQRYLYEIVRSIDKKKFEVGVLCGINSPNQHAKIKEDYYFLLEKEKVKMYPFLEFRTKPQVSSKKRLLHKIEDSLDYRLGVKLRNKKVNNNTSKINELINSYDRIVVIDWYTYLNLKNILDKCIHKVDVHILCNALQYNENIYENFTQSLNYNFFYFNNLQPKEFKAGGLHNTTNHFLPLLIEADDYKLLPISPPNLNEEINIGVFTRIAENKRIEVYIFSLLLLINKYKRKNYKLKIFGFIQSQEYKKYLDGLITFHQLNDYIEFKGHSDSISDSIIKENVKIGWLPAVGESIGYAGIEIALFGLPCIFMPVELFPETIDKNIPLLIINNMDEFVSKTIETIEDTENYSLFCKKQSEYIKNKHDSSKHIHFFESYLENKLRNNQA